MRIKLLILSGLLCLGAATELPAAAVILNEYNAVGSTSKLDAGTGRDKFFGSIFGNGGNWFELLVVDDVDLRGWSLVWNENELTQTGQTATGTITFADNELWSSVQRGTLLTLIETADAGGELVNGQPINTATDTSFNPDAGDWWINVSTREENTKGAAGLVTTTTNHGAAGDFSTGNNDWSLTIRDAQQNVVFGPAGEGATGWTGPGINNEEGVGLEGPPAPATLEIWQAISGNSDFYDDTGTTSFGDFNHGYDPAAQTFVPRQDVSPLRGSVGPMPGDFDSDSQLTVADIDLLSTEVRAGTNNAAFDLNSDSLVNDSDRTIWVESLRNTYFGDADLDGQFNSSDLVSVLAAGTYEADVDAGWLAGDFNGDGRTNSSDLVTALAGGGYEAGPRAAVAAVPEPSTLGSAVAAILLLVGSARGRRS
jgi:hypothetical protein